MVSDVDPVRGEANAPEWLQALYPFRGRAFEHPGGSMHYLDEGEGTTAVLMVHGNPTWSFYYRGLVLALRGRFRCIAPDHLGCGLSDKPRDAPYTLAWHIDNLERLVDALGLQRIILAVHDWGGPIGLGMALRRPERIAGLVLLNTAAFPDARIPRRIALLRSSGVLGEAIIRGLNGFAAPACRMAVARRPLSAEVRKGYLFPYDSWDNRIALYRFVRDIPMSPADPSFSLLCEIAAGLARFRDLPVWIGWGAKDFCFTDAFLQRWQEIFPHATTRRLPDAGHYVLEDAGEELIPQIRRYAEALLR